MRGILALAISVPMLVAQTEQRAPQSVTAIRHWSASDVTRVAIEVSGEFEFRTDRLHEPERVYYDILNARPRLDGGRRYYSEILSDKLVSRIRVAETTPGVTRVVLDLTGGVEAATSQLTNPSRLVVEVRSTGAPATPAPPAIAAPPPASPAVPPQLVRLPATVKPETPLPLKPPATPVIKAGGGGDDRPSPLEPVVRDRAPVGVVRPADDKPADDKRRSPAPPIEIATAAKHTSAGDTSLVRALGLKITRVVIDPGHGGHDRGTEGPHGLLEKDLVLDIAKRVGMLIEDRMGSEVIYTRRDDTFVPLGDRTALANDKKADLFLSIHANSSSFPRIGGMETFYLNVTGSKEALDVAARENASSQKSIFELQDLLQKITQRDKAEESREFAGRVQAALYALSARNLPASKNRGVKSAPFVVLIGANMPSVLAEIGFLSNPREETLLKRPDYRQKLAEALYRGIQRYAQSLSHFQMALN